MRGIVVCLLGSVLAGIVLGQEFEAVSEKPNKSGSNSSHSTSDPGMLTANNVSLRSLIVMAYGLNDYQVEGPEWLRLERFDVAAKFPEALPKDRQKLNAARQAMMQKMLVDLFKLAVHRDQKMFPVYGLVVGKSGVKFKEGPDCGSKNQSQDDDNNHYVGTCNTMAAFAVFLARQMDLPVIDMTGLKGSYNLTLDWVPEVRQSGDSKGAVPAVADIPAGPTLAVAIEEQLGLKFAMRKAPIGILVVDHAERTPAEN